MESWPVEDCILETPNDIDIVDNEYVKCNIYYLQ